jgi:hypothetical protein
LWRFNSPELKNSLRNGDCLHLRRKRQSRPLCRGQLVPCEGGAPLLHLLDGFGIQYLDDVREPAEEAVADADDVDRDRPFVGNLRPDVRRVVLVPERVVPIRENSALLGVHTVRAVFSAAAILADHRAGHDLVLREGGQGRRHHEPSGDESANQKRKRRHSDRLGFDGENPGDRDDHNDEDDGHDDETHHGFDPPKMSMVQRRFDV